MIDRLFWIFQLHKWRETANSSHCTFCYWDRFFYSHWFKLV